MWRTCENSLSKLPLTHYNPLENIKVASFHSPYTNSVTKLGLFEVMKIEDPQGQNKNIMKKLLTAIALLLISTTAMAQEKPPAIIGQSIVTKEDKLVESFVLGKKKFNIYLSEKISDEDGRISTIKLWITIVTSVSLNFPNKL